MGTGTNTGIVMLGDERKLPTLVRAVDIGGDGVRMADVDGITITNTFSVLKKEFDGLDPIVKLLEVLRATMTPGTVGVAISIAGVVEDYNVVVSSPNFKSFQGAVLATAISEVLRLPVIVCNDMDGAGTGMHMLCPDAEDFLALTISSGIGGRRVKNGKVLSAMECGHIQIDPSPFAPMCGCGLRGCAEGILGGRALKRRILAETDALGVSIPNGMTTWAFLDECFGRHEPWALDIYDMFANGYGTLFATYRTTLGVSTFIVKGTLGKKMLPLIEKDIRRYMRARLRINHKWADELKIIICPEPDGIVNADAFIGAAKLLEQMPL